MSGFGDIAIVVVVVVVVAVATVSGDGIVRLTSVLFIDLICSISMSEQLSEFDRAESMEVMVISTALSLALGDSSGFSTAGLASPSISSSRGCATKLLLLMSSMALRSC